jgi:hypothetical protein
MCASEGRRLRVILSKAMVVMIAFSGVCGAQTREEVLQGARDLEKPAVDDAPLDTITVTGRTRIEISAGTEGQEAAITYGDLAKQRWRLLFNAPLDKESGEAQFANLDGLANSTRITWEGRQYRVAAAPKSEAAILVPNCTRLRAVLKRVTPKPDSPLEKFDKKVNANNGDGCLSNWFLELKDLQDPQLAAFAGELKSIREDVISRLAEKTWINVVAFKATGGIRSYEFISIGTTSAAKESIDEDVYSAELTSTWYHPQRVLLSVGARWENTTKAKPSGTVCPASTAGEPVTCLTGSVGAPENVENTVGFVEMKWAPRGGTLAFAMSPRISYEIEEGVFGIDLPIYFLRTKSNDKGDRDFVGGLRLGWRDDDDELIAGIFVGKKLALGPD